MTTDTPEGFYLDVQYKRAAFRLRIDRELVEDELGVERVSRAAFEDWAALNLMRLSEAAFVKSKAAPPQPAGDNGIVLLSRGDLDDF